MNVIWRRLGRAAVAVSIVLKLSNHVSALEVETIKLVTAGTTPSSTETVCTDEPGKFTVDGVGKLSCYLIRIRPEDIRSALCQQTITDADGEGPVVFDRCPNTCATVGLGPCAPTTTFSTFIDVTNKIVDYADEELANNFVYLPWPNFLGPMVFDVNGDGFPDTLQHHHIDKNFFTEGAAVGTYWDLATSVVDSNKNVTYKASKVDVVYQITDVTDTDPPDILISQERCRENLNFTEDVSCLLNSDFHAFISLDFDRDGRMDVFNSIGGGNGAGEGISIESMLFWGEDVIDSESSLRLNGGRQALIDAGLFSGEPQRTYGLQAADFNSDGYLDFFYVNHIRKTDLKAPGHIYINRGASAPRKFDIHREVSEFSNAALLTDFDQDGFAQELLVLQKNCKLKELEDEKCNVQPKCVVYKWNDTMGAFEKIWSSPPFPEGTTLVSAASGDFNRDGLTDVVVLYKKGGKTFLNFWYSSGENVMLNSATVVDISDSVCGIEKPRHSMRVADFDLDGRLDILVVCVDGTGSILTQSLLDDDVWEPVAADVLGPLADVEYIEAPAKAFTERCFGDSLDPDPSLDPCEIDEEDLDRYEYTFGSNPQVSGQGVTVYDYNNDGFLDIYMAIKNGFNFLFENKGVLGNTFLSFKLRGTTSNVDGIGAVMVLVWKTPSGNKEPQLREHSSQSFESDPHGARDSRIIFGLGNGGKPLKLTVRWPSGKISIFTNKELKKWPMTTNYNEITIITEPE